MKSIPAQHTQKEQSPKARRLSVELLHLNYGPKGEIEGLMTHLEGRRIQVVVEKAKQAFLPLLQLLDARTLEITSCPRPPSSKGEPVHEVHDLQELVSVDGRPVADGKETSSYSGTVVRLNYAKHGVPNGVVLDSGHFIHLKPDGMTASRLTVGAQVVASGESRRLADGSGLVIEAATVNGKKIHRD